MCHYYFFRPPPPTMDLPPRSGRQGRRTPNPSSSQGVAGGAHPNNYFADVSLTTSFPSGIQKIWSCSNIEQEIVGIITKMARCCHYTRDRLNWLVFLCSREPGLRAVYCMHKWAWRWGLKSKVWIPPPVKQFLTLIYTCPDYFLYMLLQTSCKTSSKLQKTYIFWPPKCLWLIF